MSAAVLLESPRALATVIGARTTGVIGARLEGQPRSIGKRQAARAIHLESILGPSSATSADALRRRDGNHFRKAEGVLGGNREQGQSGCQQQRSWQVLGDGLSIVHE